MPALFLYRRDLPAIQRVQMMLLTATALPLLVALAEIGLRNGTTSGAASEVVEITFWQSVEASGTAAEYRAYLERYPNGCFAALAQARLGSTSTTQARSPDPSVGLAFWNSIKDSDDQALFLAYLEKYPNGEFRSLAEIHRAADAPSGIASLSGLLKSAFSTDA